MSFLDRLPDRYRTILCDIWGCVHDGAHLYPGAADRLSQWRSEGRKVVLITNAPRTADAVEQQLTSLGLPASAWDSIVTSGEAGIAAVNRLETAVGFIGTEADREILEGRGVPIASDAGFADLACTGLREDQPDPQSYRHELQEIAGRGVTMHCLNPDRVVIHRGERLACAGALADIYAELGGQIEWYGKPFASIYRHALGCVGDPSPEEVLAIGDSLATDMLGAARMGFDCVFVTGGIHGGAEVPADFATENDLGDWQPLAVLPSLA